MPNAWKADSVWDRSPALQWAALAAIVSQVGLPVLLLIADRIAFPAASVWIAGGALVGAIAAPKIPVVAAAAQRKRENDARVCCPHCGRAGLVITKAATRKAGFLLKTHGTACTCQNCGSSWFFQK